MNYREDTGGPLPPCSLCGELFEPDDYDRCLGCTGEGTCEVCESWGNAETLLIREESGSLTRIGCYCITCRAGALAEIDLTEDDTVEL